MDKRLQLKTIRGVLNRLEDTIIFALIERAQFKQNRSLYERGAFAPAIGAEETLVGYLLHETETIHARMRRYTNFEEVPFTSPLPDPILPPRNRADELIRPNNINVNDRIRSIYERDTIPVLCEPGDDGQYGSSSVCDVTCLQAISTRVHYGKIIAESKYCSEPDACEAALRADDREALRALITNPAVEAEVLQRVHLKASAYGQEPGAPSARARINAHIVTDLYRQSIIPLTKQVEVDYLLTR